MALKDTSINQYALSSDNKKIAILAKKAKDKSDKKLNDLVNSVVLKFIYTKGIIKSLELSDNLNLPAPIPVVPTGMFEKKK